MTCLQAAIFMYPRSVHWLLVIWVIPMTSVRLLSVKGSNTVVLRVTSVSPWKADQSDRHLEGDNQTVTTVLQAGSFQ